ncbi:MAG: GNAT family N-acetyltransferase, partial [Thermodesulfovibrionales bacterium]|nr:GNAT family N-acetyltransferase [Thermodesulfovibrionales bacterium]
MNDNLIKRRFVEDDKDKIVKLFEYVFQDKASTEWLDWKYFNSPWGSVGYIAQYGQEVICFYGGIKQRFIFNNQILLAYQLCLSLIHI